MSPDPREVIEFVAPRLVSPWWLRVAQHETDVLVYGGEDGGHFLVRVPDGSTALIDPRPGFF